MKETSAQDNEKVQYNTSPSQDTNRTPSNFSSLQHTEELQSTTDILRFNSDSFLWNLNGETRDFITMNGIPRNDNTDFKNSKNVYNDKTRYCSKSLFQRTLKNGEI